MNTLNDWDQNIALVQLHRKQWKHHAHNVTSVRSTGGQYECAVTSIREAAGMQQLLSCQKQH